MAATIYDAIGGEPAVNAAVESFYEKVWADPDLLEYFATADRERLKGHQRAFLTTALGGPTAYAGKSMAEAHKGRGISAAAFDRVVEHLVATLKELGVGEDTVSAIGAKLGPLKPEVVEA
ncbi:MAG: group 1 truncated hemoglobin [Solirubrobacterales bacterium]|nr:group 1 truncated hemoglobin [Solirubrobacterales bacterium]